MNQKEKAKRFAQFHVKGSPVLLYNAWDAGSARSVLEAGAKAIATSSWSVAAAQGYQDGEIIPIELAEEIVGRIASSVDAPVTVDFEGGYSEDDRELALAFHARQAEPVTGQPLRHLFRRHFRVDDGKHP